MSDTAAAPAPKKSKKLVIVAAIVLLLGAGGAGAAWFVMGKQHKDGAAHAEEKKPPKKALYTTLEPFTVNLQDPRGERFAQIGVSLQFDDPDFEVQLKDKLPAVRNAILLLISSKQIEELLSTEGKQKLAQEIRFQSARAMGIAVVSPEAAKKEAEEDARREKERAARKAEHDGDKADEADSEPDPPRRKKRGVENPVRDVLFSQFIVQ